MRINCKHLRPKRSLAIACLTIFLLVNSSCARTLDRTISNSSQVVVSAGTFDNNPSFCDSGLLFQGLENFHYYDLATKTDYMLCAVPNCRHNSEACPAWFSDDAATGLALYGDHVYAIKRNDRTNTLDAVQMDITGGNQRVVASLPQGDFKPGEWILKSVGKVIYAAGFMWFDACYGYVEKHEYGSGTTEDCNILYGIRLSDGQVTRLGDFPDTNTPHLSEKNPYMTFDMITPFALTYTKIWYDPPFLGEEQFVKSEYFERFADSRDPYYEYTVWHDLNATTKVETFLYNPLTGSTELLDGDERIHWTENGISNGYLGYRAGCILQYRVDTNSAITESQVFAIDFTTKERKLLLDINNGDLVATRNDGFSSAVVDGNKLLYMIYLDDGMADVYAFNMDTGESTYLYQDVDNIRFRIFGETSECILAIVHGDYLNTYYKISKDNYFAGNIDAAEKLFSTSH